jgi:dihydrofolate reductase
MADVHYVTNVSLDGFIEDASGAFDFSEPSDDVFAFITELVRPFGTYLYGRRLYETMAVWETEPALAEQSELSADFANVWCSAEKVVYSTTLEKPSTAHARIERTFDPDAVRALKASATSDFMIGGAVLAARAFDAGLVDECHLFVSPVLLGAGKPAYGGAAHVQLELLDERRFDNGALYLRHRVRR